ncbi:MAG: CHASE3 domain-containing protein [Steroidobacteraceae bacterium]
MWTFGKKIVIGFTISFVLLAVIGTVAYRAINSLTTTSYAVTHTHQVLEHIARLLIEMENAETGQRGYVITGDDGYLAPYQSGIAAVDVIVKELRELTADNPSQQKRLDRVEPLIAAKLAELKRTVDMRRSAGFEPAQKVVIGGEGKRAMDDIRAQLQQMQDEENTLLARRASEVEMSATVGRETIGYGTVACLLFVAAAAFLLTHSLTRQITLAVNQVKTSSTELQAAANQQAAGAKESATAMSEITTTISELMATSRQIAESAQHVAQIAEQTTSAARSGETTMQQARESIDAIRRQMDQVVNHMLDLGKKSQQIGAVIDVVGEMAEQTNILAINASIEAAGASDAGKRFAVVADEIRKLADRVTGSTKEIRTLIEDVRSAVNTTVMATETGSKAVDAGARHFGDVAVAFQQIAGSVTTTRQAAREIELSTKQQSTAVEQVNNAVTDVAQSTKETEVSSTQTLQTVSQLAGLSTDLLRLVQPQRAA